MTIATLSFTTPGRVTFRCDELGIDDRRDLETSPPFAEWSQLYATGYWSAEALLGIGLAIGEWLDGRQHWLARLMEAPAPVILVIETGPHPDPIEKAALDAPWELIARRDPAAAGAATAEAPAARQDVDPAEPAAIAEMLARWGPAALVRARHLALDPGLLVTVVRRLGPAGKPRPPSRYRLSVVFMAAQPDGIAGLAVDREEVAIRKATGTIGMDLAVEDSGSLDRLGEMVARAGECDVIQVSCHGSMRERPVVMLEDPLGGRVDATADDLSLGIGHKPRLMFLSACSTARASDALWSLSVDLCRRGWPAVLGWSCAVSDAGAIELAAALYRQLALRVPLAEALAQARVVLASKPGAEWHKARLFLGPAGGGKIVDGTYSQPDWPDPVRDQAFLDSYAKTIPVAPADRPFPYRRALQRVMTALREGSRSGVAIAGGDELARATIAARVLHRIERDLPRVVVSRDLDAQAILKAISVQKASAEIDAIVDRFRDARGGDAAGLAPALREIIEGPCRNPGEGALVLVLHGFDPVVAPDPPADHRHDLGPGRLLVARALIRAFTGARTASRLMFTSAAPFSVIENGRDLADALLIESLARP